MMGLEHPGIDLWKSRAACSTFLSFTSSALLHCTLTIVRLGMISLFVHFISWLVVVDRWQCGAVGLSGPPSSWSPPLPSSSLVSCMKLASCPGQGLCLSHARLDPRYFIALTLPPTVTAALNEPTHALRAGRAGARRPAEPCRLDIFTTSTSACCGPPPVSVSYFYSGEKWRPRYTGPHRVSSGDNGCALSDYSEDYRA